MNVAYLEQARSNKLRLQECFSFSKRKFSMVISFETRFGTPLFTAHVRHDILLAVSNSKLLKMVCHRCNVQCILLVILLQISCTYDVFCNHCMIMSLRPCSTHRSESFFWRTNQYVIRVFHMKESYVASTCLS